MRSPTRKRSDGFSMLGVVVTASILFLILFGTLHYQKFLFRSSRTLAQVGEYSSLSYLVSTLLVNPDSCRLSLTPIPVDGNPHPLQFVLANGDTILSPGLHDENVEILSADATIPIPIGGSLVSVSTAEINLTVGKVGAPAGELGKTLRFNVDLVIGTGTVWSCLRPGQTPGGHLLFARRGSVSGNLGGLAGADSLCQNSASAAGLGTNWTAVLGDRTTSARSRITIVGPVYNMNGDLIAMNEGDLWDGTIQNVVRYGEDKSDQWGHPVLTGAGPDGSIQCYDGMGAPSTQTCCDDWTNGSPTKNSGNIGRTDRTDRGWVSIYTGTFGNGCEPGGLVIYCVSGWNS